MKKQLFFILTVGIVFSLIAGSVEASNNIFGLHVSSNFTEDIETTASTVNSSGGDWGYITVVIQENSRNHEMWQKNFDLFREKHLIPIVRIATGASGKSWKRGNISQLPNWISFLNGLNWPVKDRYVILFNEPNHGSEWGGSCDPIDYAQIAIEYAKALKDSNQDFVPLLAGLDQSAPQIPPYYCDEGRFLQVVFSQQPTLSSLIGGLVSHSYPNPGYLGKPTDTGRGSIVGYRWELETLRSLGVSQDLPVFITETAWPTGRGYYSEDKSANYLQDAFKNIWMNDSSVKAVTVFDLNIGGALANFSLKNEDGSLRMAVINLQSIPKVAGNPAQVDSADILTELPKRLKVNDTFKSAISITNSGQSIWSERSKYELKIDNLSFPISISPLPFLKPGEVGHVKFDFTPTLGVYEASILLLKDGKILREIGKWKFEVAKPPLLLVSIDGHPAIEDELEVQIFDKDERLLYKNSKVVFMNGKSTIDDFLSGDIGAKYRLVVLKKRFLPRQATFILGQISNNIFIEKMLGLDLDQDGQFTLGDVF